MAWTRVFGRAQTPLNSSNLALLHYYCNTTVLLLYFCTTIELLLYYYGTATVLLYYYCITTVLLHVLLQYTTAPYQASDVVDCGGEAEVFKMTGFSLGR